MRLMRACANGLRTMPSHSIPGSAMSSTYVAAPVSSSGSSLRSWLVPTNLLGFSTVAIRHLPRRPPARP